MKAIDVEIRRMRMQTSHRHILVVGFRLGEDCSKVCSLNGDQNGGGGFTIGGATGLARAACLAFSTSLAIAAGS